MEACENGHAPMSNITFVPLFHADAVFFWFMKRVHSWNSAQNVLDCHAAFKYRQSNVVMFCVFIVELSNILRCQSRGIQIRIKSGEATCHTKGITSSLLFVRTMVFFLAKQISDWSESRDSSVSERIGKYISLKCLSTAFMSFLTLHLHIHAFP